MADCDEPAENVLLRRDNGAQEDARLEQVGQTEDEVAVEAEEHRFEMERDQAENSGFVGMEGLCCPRHTTDPEPGQQQCKAVGLKEAERGYSHNRNLVASEEDMAELAAQEARSHRHCM